MVYYYRVSVVEDEEGKRPDCPPPFSVVEYLDDGTVIVRRSEPLHGVEEQSLDEVDSLVKNPIHKVLDVAGRLYGFRSVDGIVQVGIDKDGIICLRKVETVKIPVAVDAEGNTLETREVQRVKLIQPPFDRVLAIRDGRLVVLEKSEGGWKLVDEEDPEIPLPDGSSIKFSEVKMKFVE